MSKNELDERVELYGIEYEELVEEEKQKKSSNYWIFLIIDAILIVLLILSVNNIICNSFACLAVNIVLLVLLGISIIISIILWFKRGSKL